MKQFKDFRTFKKVTRKYWKRYATKFSIKHNGRKGIGYWTSNIWCYYLANTVEDLQKVNIREWFKYDVEESQIDEFVNNYKDMFDKSISFYTYGIDTPRTGIFRGFSLVNNGVLFAIEENNEISLYPFSLKIEKNE